MSEVSVEKIPATAAKSRALRAGQHPLLQLTLVRFYESIREPEALFWMFIFPVLLTAGLGIAFRNRPPEVLKVAATTPELTQALKRNGGLDVRQLTPAQAKEELRRGEIALAAHPAAPGGVAFEYDDTNPEGRTARLLADDAIQRAAGRTDRVRATNQLMREPGSRYIDFLVPGLVGMNLMASSTWSIGFAIVDARRRKLLKRLVATPMPRHYFLLSFILSRLAMLVFEVVVLIGFGVVIFGVPVRGSLFVLAVVCVIGAFTFSALGLLIASRAKTTEAATGLLNTVTMPMWILSGVFFSAQRFPAILQPFIKALPLTDVVDALRANMLQGAGFVAIVPELAILAAWIVATFALGLALFRWR